MTTHSPLIRLQAARRSYALIRLQAARRSYALIRLQAARRSYEAASGACVHWDMEGSTGDHECCRELDDAQRELSAARKAYAKAQTSQAAA